MAKAPEASTNIIKSDFEITNLTLCAVHAELLTQFYRQCLPAEISIRKYL